MSVLLPVKRVRSFAAILLTLSLLGGLAVTWEAPASAAPVGTLSKFVPVQPQRGAGHP